MSTIQVDRIIPYQSSSVTVEGLSAPNLATTGSNTFVGDQIIQGTITASIQEGFALVGGVGNVSTLVATSSFGGALPAGVVSGSSQLTASYDQRYALSGSGGGGSGFPFTGDAVITGSLTVSGSTSIIPVIAPNTPPGGLTQFTIPFLSGSSNTFARDLDNALLWVPLFNQLAVSSSTANTAITPGGMSLTSGTTGSTALSTTRVASNFGSGRHLGIAGDAASTNLTGLAGITTPAIIAQSGSVGLPTFYTPIQFESSQSFTDGRVTVTRPLIAQQGVQITGSVNVSGNTFISSSQLNLTGSGGSYINIFEPGVGETASGIRFYSGSTIDQTGKGAQLSVSPGALNISSFGAGATTFVDFDFNNPQVLFSKGVRVVGNNNLTISSGSASATHTFSGITYTRTSGTGSTISGNQIGLTNDTQYFATMNPSFGLDLFKQTNNAYLNFNVDNAAYGNSGWAGAGIGVANADLSDYPVVIGFQSGQDYTDGRVSVLKRLDVSGSINPSPNNQVKFQTGSNQQAGTAVLDGGNPGTVTVSNSLVTANSIILVSKQTLTNPNGYVAVSSKGTGTFTITSNHNGDNDTVGYLIINNV